MDVLEQPGSETREHIIVAIRKWRPENVDKWKISLADIDVPPPWGSV